MTYDLTYLSLGAGVQSTALLVMSAKGLHGCPRADHAIFADTGDEPRWVMDHLEWCKSFATGHGIELHVATAGRLSDHIRASANGTRNAFSPIPAYTMGEKREGLLRRQCTREYKLEPIQREVRRLLGAKKGARLAKGTRANAMIGISIDEATRAKPSRVWWIENTFPLLDAGMRRSDCKALLDKHGAPVPRKSSCVFCPYKADRDWLELRDESPEDFAAAVDVDRVLRDATKKGAAAKAYVHRSCKPLDEVDFTRWKDLDGQQFLFDAFDNECEGMCGV